MLKKLGVRIAMHLKKNFPTKVSSILFYLVEKKNLTEIVVSQYFRHILTEKMSS